MFDLGGGRVGAVIGDVVGHGVKATAEMARLRTAIATLVRIGTDLDNLFAGAQSIISAERRSAFLGTAVFAETDADAGRLRSRAAGHPAPWSGGRTVASSRLRWAATQSSASPLGAPFRSRRSDEAHDDVALIVVRNTKQH